MKIGDIVRHRRDIGMPGLLLTWWEWPGDEERNDEIYWRVLMNGGVRDIKERHLEVISESR